LNTSESQLYTYLYIHTYMYLIVSETHAHLALFLLCIKNFFIDVIHKYTYIWDQMGLHESWFEHYIPIKELLLPEVDGAHDFSFSLLETKTCVCLSCLPWRRQTSLKKPSTTLSLVALKRTNCSHGNDTVSAFTQRESFLQSTWLIET